MNNGQLHNTTTRVTNVPWVLGPRPFIGVGDNGAVTTLHLHPYNIIGINAKI